MNENYLAHVFIFAFQSRLSLASTNMDKDARKDGSLLKLYYTELWNASRYWRISYSYLQRAQCRSTALV